MNSTTLEQNKVGLDLESTQFQNFRASIHGQIILKHDASYDEERSVYNGMIDRYPALIVKCRDVADVIACVNFGRENQIRTAIRGGGHNAGGLGVCDDGIVIDLSLMKGIRVDQKTNTLRAEGGCLLSDIDHATQPFGKAVPSGILGSTGISGLEVDIVLADGSLITASAKENEDLFWAVRGGGGNFGVITSFLFKMHDAGVVYGGPMLWHIQDAEQVMPFYRDYILKAPNSVYCYFAFLTVPPVPIFPTELHLKKMCGLVWCNTGDSEKAKSAVDTFRKFKEPALDYTGPIPYSALQGLFDALYPKGLQWYWKADFVKELSDDSIKLNIKHGNRLPSTHSTMHLYPINGAAHKAKNSDTAFSYRDANWAQVIVGVDPEPANKEKISTWAKNYWEELHPFSAGGAYVNFMMEEGQERIKASYRENYERLVKVKAKYDPQNFFRINQNIKPA